MRQSRGFTIVELLIVIVVIAILAALTIVAFSNLMNRAAVSALKSDLDGAAKTLSVDNFKNGQYPTTAASANGGNGLRSSAGSAFQYTYGSSDNSYCLTITSERVKGSSYTVSSSDTTVRSGFCSGHSAVDPNLVQPLVIANSTISAIAIDQAGSYYLLSPEGYASRVQVFDVYRNQTAFFGATGTGQDQLGTGSYSSWAIYVGPDANIYVADGGNAQFKVFSKSGGFVRTIGLGNGTADGYLSRPYGITFDSQGNTWVADRGNQRVQKFSSSGAYLSKFGSAGSAQGSFNEPNAITIDGSDTLYVTDRNNHRIQSFTLSGSFVRQYGTGTAGAGDGQLNQPVFTLLDASSGDLYVYELVNMRISVFGNDGSFKRKFTTLPSGSTSQRSFSMAWEPNGDITLSIQNDNQSYRLVTYTKSGAFVRAY